MKASAILGRKALALTAGSGKSQAVRRGPISKPFQFIGVLCAIGVTASVASPICVSNTSDSGAGSLRAAITQANNAGGGEITFCTTGTITLLSPLASLTNLTITGPGTNLLTVSGNNQFRVFRVNSGSTNTLSGLTIANGSVSNYSLTFPPYYTDIRGAGISNAGSLTLLDCALRACTNITESSPAGGGIYNAGSLVMKRCQVTDCVAWGIYGGFYSIYGGNGGGIDNDGDVQMEDCTLSDCAGYYGGGIWNSFHLFLTNCIIQSCEAPSEADGGGILSLGNLTMHSCTVSNCAAYWGGGIESWGNCSITNSAILANSTWQDIGGGLCLWGTSQLVGCTVSGNSAGLAGGGVFNNGVLGMLNCTISENSTEGGYGSGLANVNYMVLSTNLVVYAYSCTFASNTSGSSYSLPSWPASAVGNRGTFNARDTIFAGEDTNDFLGVLTSEGHNLIQNTLGCAIVGDETGNIYNADPMLGPLRDNGGPTWTHALLTNSPAIDAGSDDGSMAMDQRGIHRPQGLAPDIGAFEFQYVTPVLVRVAVQSCTNCSLKLCGLRGGIYTLQASTNLVDWFNVATNMADINGVCEFTESSGVRCSRRFYRISLPVPAGSLYIPAPSGIVDAPFVITDPYISQPVYTGASDGGRAEYPFMVPRAGTFILQATVNAANDSVNSLFVNIDGEPRDPAMIWDVLPYTSSSGFEPRTISWRGTGSDTSDEFAPMVFSLAEGPHKLIIRGREADTGLQSIAIVPFDAVYLPVSAATVTPPLMVANDYLYQPIETKAVADSGRAVFGFTVTNAGSYVIRASVNASADGANSFFLNVDAEPEDPTMIWDIFPLTAGFEERTVSWRGNGTDTNNQFVPKVFNLSLGSHQLILRGREANTLLQDLLLVPYPQASLYRPWPLRRGSAFLPSQARPSRFGRPPSRLAHGNPAATRGKTRGRGTGARG